MSAFVSDHNVFAVSVSFTEDAMIFASMTVARMRDEEQVSRADFTGDANDEGRAHARRRTQGKLRMVSPFDRRR